MDEIYLHALKVLQRRDHTVAQLSQKLEAKFGSVPEDVIARLLQKKFLDDRRFAENYVARRRNRGTTILREELAARGIPPTLAEEILSSAGAPSLKDVLAAKMNDWKLRRPLQSRDAARLFRALTRLGYEEDAIREEIEQIRER
ncbi:MAG TPA: RecX family transcriptional regulator [Terriglobia bacterium]|nr:RecX family transcriptional regulator [Terriglobia bacterium]